MLFTVVVPTDPKIILAIERFIALHIIRVSINPDAPTNAPQIMSMLLDRTKPVAAAARPEQEFSVEITTGISAPPIGMTNKIPSSRAIARMASKPVLNAGLIMTTMPIVRNRVKSSTFSNRWALNTTGADLTTPCSLPKATRLPVKVTAPMKRLITMEMITSILRSPASRLYSANATSAEAQPPSPLKSATI